MNVTPRLDDSAPVPASTFSHSRSRERQKRRQRSNTRVFAPITHPVRDPLARPGAGAAKRLGRVAILIIAGIVLHVLILAGFIGANLISQAMEEEEVVEAQPTEVAVLEPVEEQEKEPPPPEPEPPSESFEPSYAAAPEAAPQPQIGISADSTVEGGTGPAFQTGMSLGGPMLGGGLAQEILGRETKVVATPQEMVMTADTVDTQPKPMGSNRPPVTPAKARQKNISGVVVVRMMIGPDGSVQEANVLRANPPGIFEENVLEVVSTWRFSPALYKGQPVSMRVDQSIRFDVK